MGWERFHASCRRHLRQQGEDFAATLEYFRSYRARACWGHRRGAIRWLTA